MAMACATMPPMTFRRMEWSSKKLQHPDNTYSYRQRSPTEGNQQFGSRPLSAKQPLLAAGAASQFLVSKSAVLQPRYKPQRRESYETAQSTAMEGDFSYPDPLACAEGPSEFHKRIAVLQQCVQDTRKWELYHKRILSQGTPAPSLLPTSYGSRVHSLHRAMSHVDGSTSSTDLVESTDKKRHKRPVLRRGISLPDMVVAADLSSNQDRIVLSHPSGRSVRTGSSAAEQVHVSTCTAAQLCKSSSAHNERDVKAALSAEKTVKKRGKPVLAASDKVDQLPPSTMGNTVEEHVQPPTPAPPIAKQTRKKHSYSRPTSAKLVHKSKPAKKQPRTQSAK